MITQKERTKTMNNDDKPKFKDHEIGRFVNDVTAIAVKYAGCQSMRGALSAYITPKLQESIELERDSVIDECIDIAKNTAGTKTQIIKALNNHKE